MKQPGGLFAKKWHLIAPVLVLNSILLWIAYSRWSELTRFAGELGARVPIKAQNEAFDALEKAAALAARTHDLELFERARTEQAIHLLQSDLHPNTGAALYFYPETLPAYSLEREFAFRSLKPGIENLRSAFVQREPASTQKAYRVLESRVVNFEGGSAAHKSDLTPEAQSFLRVYGNFRIAGPVGTARGTKLEKAAQ